MSTLRSLAAALSAAIQAENQVAIIRARKRYFAALEKAKAALTR